MTIIYQDEHIVVVDKPSGFLSVPGRGIEKIDSVAHRISTIIPGCIDQPAVHRLDMDTSGLLVLALTKEAHRNPAVRSGADTATSSTSRIRNRAVQ